MVNMNKNIYIVRHVEATGQEPDASLTEKGFGQAEELCDLFTDMKVDKIISSPYLRAVQTIEPLAEKHQLKIETDPRLKERVLSSQFFPNWLVKLEASYKDMNLKYEGGESGIEAMNRIVEIVEEMISSDLENIVLVAHGGIISLLLHHYDKTFGFEQWKELSNPDVFLLDVTKDNSHYKRIWNE